MTFSTVFYVFFCFGSWEAKRSRVNLHELSLFLAWLFIRSWQPKSHLRQTSLTLSQMTKFQTLPNWKSLQTTISYLIKKFNGRKFSTGLENTVGKPGEIAHDEQFLLFPTVFSKDLFCRHVKTRACRKRVKFLYQIIKSWTCQNRKYLQATK